MTYSFILAIIAIESGGRQCVKHRNPVIHGATGMSEVALAEIGMKPKDVQCNLQGAINAMRRYQENYIHLTKGDPWSMAILHSSGPGALKRGKLNEEYMRRFALLFEE